MTYKTIDINKLIQSIRKSKPSNLYYFSVNELENDSIRKMLKELESIVGTGKGSGSVIWIKN